MLANMASSLILHKRIKTTTAKAKALRMYVEPLITKSKDDSTHSRRVVFSYLKDKVAVNELFREVSSKIADRPGGYTRILKTGNRLGDNADMCIIELVDYNENMLQEKETSKAKPTRRRRSKKKPVAAGEESGTKATSEEVAEATKEKVVEAKVAEETAKEEESVEVKAEEVVEEKPGEVEDEVEAKVEEANVEEAEKVEAKKEETTENAPEEETKPEKKDDKSEDKYD